MDDVIDFEQIARLSPVGMCVLDRQLRYVFCNQALADINGLPAEAHIGRSVSELLPELAPQVEEAFIRAFDYPTRASERKVYGATPKFPHVERVWLERIRPLSEGAETQHLLVTVLEITALEQAEEALRKSERNFRVSQQLSPDGFAILSGIRNSQDELVDFRIDYANPEAERLAHAAPLAGQSLLTLFPGATHLFDWFVRAASGHEARQTEIFFEEGAVAGWFRISAVLIDDNKLAVGVRDVTRRKEAEQRLITSNREFQHRLQNILTIVSAMVLNSAKSANDPAQLSRDLIARIAALSEAQRLLTSDPESAPLGMIVNSALRPFAMANLQVGGGPQVVVEAESVVPLTLALNELATNAVKYGGLSCDRARTELRWSGDRERVRLHWVEKTTEPKKTKGGGGFGTELLKRSVASLPEGELQIDHGVSGLSAEISFRPHAA